MRARWKDLCMDAGDAMATAAFWGAALGLTVEERTADIVCLRGDRPEQTIWVNRVPEPKTAKHRVHIDVSAAAREPLVDLGATIVLPAETSGFPWTVMADPEGGEFCVFVRDDAQTPPATLYELVVDCAGSDASQALSRWWADVLGGRSLDDGRGFWWLADVPGLPFAAIDFIPVPEPKTVKNRIHWDVVADDPAALVERGATTLAAPTAATPWRVCADPWGNEFCVFAP